MIIKPENIWVPRVGILEAECAFPRVAVEGEYTLTKYKADTMEVMQTVGPFKNLITDQGLNRVGTLSFASHVFVGTGTVVPTVVDTTMSAFQSGSNTPQINWNAASARGGAPDHWVQGAGTTRFPAGTAIGNLTEVGVGWLSAGGTPTAANNRVSSRALIVDGTGNPITVTVLPDEVLDVTYALRLYPQLGADVVQTINISGTVHTFTTRAIGVLSSAYLSVGGSSGSYPNASQASWSSGEVFYTGTAAGTPPALAPVTDNGMLTPGANGFPSTTRLAYVDGSLTNNATFRADLNAANMAHGIRGMLTRPIQGNSPTDSFINVAYQSTISPAIPKDATKVLQFGASHTWGRKT